MKLTLEHYLLPILLIICPFFYLPIVPDPAHSPIFLYLCIVQILIYGFVVKNHSNVRYNAALSSSLIAYLLFSGLSFFSKTHNSEASLEMSRVLFFVLTYVFFIFVINLTQDTVPLKLLTTFVIIGFVYIIYGFIDYFQYYNTNDVHKGLYDIRAHIGHKNLLSIYLACTVPFVIYFVLNTHNKFIKSFYLSYFSLSIILIFIVESRVGMIGIGINVVWFVIYFSVKKNPSAKIIIVVIIAVLFIGLLFKIFRNESYNSIVKRTKSIFLVNAAKDENTQSINERKVLWLKTVELIKDNPMTGVGLGQWKLIIPSKDINNTRAKFGNTIFQQPHNDVLWVFSELGILGGLIYLAIFTISIVNLYRKKDFELLDFILLLCVLIFFITSLFDFPKERPIHLFLLAFLLALISTRTSNQNLVVSKYGNNAIKFLLGSLILFFINRYVAENKIAQLLILRSEKNNKEVIKIGEFIKSMGIQYDQTSTPIDFYIGESYYFDNNVKMAIPYLLNSSILSPYHLYTWNNLGGAYRYINEDLKALFCWEKAKMISTDFAETRINLAYYFLNQKDYLSAINQLKFNIEKEDLKKYESEIRDINTQVIYQLKSSFDEKIISDEIAVIPSNKKRLLWLYKTYCNDSLSYKNQLLNDVLYSLCENKKMIDSTQKQIFIKKYNENRHY